jgi:hypothetical protein
VDIAPELALGAILVAVVSAGVLSVAGALRRTASRRTYGPDGGPMIGDHSDHRHDAKGGRDWNEDGDAGGD